MSPNHSECFSFTLIYTVTAAFTALGCLDTTSTVSKWSREIFITQTRVNNNNITILFLVHSRQKKKQAKQSHQKCILHCKKNVLSSCIQAGDASVCVNKTVCHRVITFKYTCGLGREDEGTRLTSPSISTALMMHLPLNPTEVNQVTFGLSLM